MKGGHYFFLHSQTHTHAHTPITPPRKSTAVLSRRITTLLADEMESAQINERGTET